MNTPIPPLSIEQAANGLPVLPIKRVRLMTDKEFEKLVESWAENLKGRYVSVAHFGGAGDKGVDVAGFCDAKGFKGVWEGFQCKHRDHPLYPTDIYADIGKLIWFIAKGDYVAPRLYGVAGSQDIGTSLSQLLHDPAALKQQIERNWESHIADEITETGRVELAGDVRAVFEGLDWSIFKHQKLQHVLDALKGTPYYIATFGGGLPPRPDPPSTPADVQPHEIVYVEKLRQAYASHTGIPMPDVAAIGMHRRMGRHFERQRRAFYCAEGLREFSKDTVPAGTFEALQEDILCGVQPVADGEHETAFIRVNQVVSQAVQLPLNSNPLASVASTLDRHGVCHQLSNDDKLSWEPEPDA